MNFLDICKRTRLESRSSGTDITTKDASGQWGLLCGYVAQSYEDIQLERDDWDWMRAEASFNTIKDQNNYKYQDVPISLTDFKRWRDGSFRIYKGTVGDEHLLEQYGYNEFRDQWLIATYKITPSYPHTISIAPDDSLYLALPPDSSDYVVTGEYYRNVKKLVDDNDVPMFSEKYHMLVVYRALMKYGLALPAPELVDYAQTEYTKMYKKLEDDNTQEFSIDYGC